MPISIGEIFDFIEFIKTRSKIKSGLFLIMVFYIILIVSFIPIGSLITFKVLIPSLIVLILIVIFWLFHSGRLVLPSKRIKLALALNPVNLESHKVIETTLLKLNSKLKILSLQNRFKLLRIGTDFIDSKEVAEEYVVNKKINLLIHGNVYYGKTNNKFRYDLSEFLFTYLIKNMPIDLKNPILAKTRMDINLMLSHRKWIIEESNSLIDIEDVSSNLMEIILGIIAIGLSLSKPDLELAILLIENLLPIIESKEDGSVAKVNLSDLKNKKEIPINFLRSGRLRSILNDCYIIISRVFFDEGDYKKGQEISLKGLNSGANKIDSYSALSLSSFHLKDLNQAVKYTQEINLISKNHPIYLVNMAFFAIIKGEYSQTLEYYNILKSRISKKNLNIINQVIIFLKERLSENPKEISFLFAIGFLTFNFKKKKDGKEILEEFYNKSGKESKYSKIHSETKKILKK